ncbi:plant UBX domain-containing protein 11 [Oryza brachyantha]|uniref:UBX domain-containing protein n=1 Tax=Oryza brachyantha TaxID=4533 RepID=J3N7K1_ORYBR|nr:plant UBX domain-containing protein 11 [Oryza brachyantha]
MEMTLDSLTYKGSIPGAINQSRRDKKLFVVYISGEDEASSSLEQSTLVNESVAEVIGNCCIFLHLKQGNVDASQFSAIYPQKAFPSISVIGLNGVMLWGHEGYIGSKDLKENIEKAWATLHVQETAAAFLTASLTSRMNEHVNTSSTTLPTQGGSSAAENPSSSSNQSTGTSGPSGFANSTGSAAQPPRSTSHDEIRRTSEKECSNLDLGPGNKTVKEKPDSDSAQVKGSMSDHPRSSNMEGHANPDQTSNTTSLKQKNKINDGCTKVSSESAPSTTASRAKSSKIAAVQGKATTTSIPIKPARSLVKSNDIQLVIRIPDGPSLQIKLTKDDNLRKVKNFVDENYANGAGSYDLAMLYPRKVFTEQDMEATLHELGIETRQALTVVPHHKPIRAAKRQSSSSPAHDVDINMDGDSSGGWGYVGYLRTALSFVNPLSYLRANAAPSNPDQLVNQGSQQYRPSSGPWRSHPGVETASESAAVAGNGSQDAARDSSSGSTLRRRPRQFGGNIHSLRSDDQGPSDDRNVYWNGNSTEFGGEDKK